MCDSVPTSGTRAGIMRFRSRGDLTGVVLMRKTISVADIARARGVRPETARARLRRMYAEDQPDLPEPVVENHWLFQARDRKKLERLITN